MKNVRRIKKQAKYIEVYSLTNFFFKNSFKHFVFVKKDTFTKKNIWKVIVYLEKEKSFLFRKNFSIKELVFLFKIKIFEKFNL